MYRWYQESVVCFAYLADVDTKTVDPLKKNGNDAFGRSRWFTRGWTLQELIAPSLIVFLNSDWREIGTKSSLHLRLSAITNIPSDILLNGDFERASVAQRMSWASKRETTRVEDQAYSLMGLFGINMPLLYGEGENAFIRLQEEIIKVSDDYSLFAWQLGTWTWVSEGLGLLATSPKAFAGSGEITSLPSAMTEAILVNNKGFHLQIHLWADPTHPTSTFALLPCRKGSMDVLIPVRPIPTKNNSYERLNYGLKFVNEGKERPFPDDSSNQRSPLFKVPTWTKPPDEPICFPSTRSRPRRRLDLFAAVGADNRKLVDFLLDGDVSIESRNELGQTALSCAVTQGKIELADLLVVRGANVDARDSNEWYSPRTPLLTAVQNGQAEMVKLLFDGGAHPDCPNSGYPAPLITVAQNGQTEIAKLLLENGANLEFKDRDGKTALSIAVQHRKAEMVKLLLDFSANLEHKNNKVETALWVAAAMRVTDTVKLQLKKWSNINAKNRRLTQLSRAKLLRRGGIVRPDPNAPRAKRLYTKVRNLLV